MSERGAGDRLGLIAGDGDLPRLAARVLRASGRLAGAVAFHGVTDEAVEREAAPVRWFALGELGAAIIALRGFGVREVLLIGGVPKRALYRERNGAREAVAFDAPARTLLDEATSWSDDALFAALAGLLEAQGLAIARQDRALAALLAEPGDFSRRTPTQDERRDVAFGRDALAAVAKAGIGQCVVVRRGCVVAVEALEGTDEAIRRAGRLAGPGCVVVKGRRAGQDPRFDLPAVGPGTIAAMVEAGARCLAVEAGATLLVDRDALRVAAELADVACTAYCVASPVVPDDAVSSLAEHRTDRTGP